MIWKEPTNLSQDCTQEILFYTQIWFSRDAWSKPQLESMLKMIYEVNIIY